MATNCGTHTVLGIVLIVLSLSHISTSQGDTYGSYHCQDTVTGERVDEGTFFDQNFSPFFHPTDPNHYGGHYYNNMQCQYTMTAPAGQHIFIEFIVFLLDPDDCDGDYVMLYLPDQELRKICGQPSGYIYDIFATDRAEFTFTSNNAVRYQGFSGYFTTYDPTVKRSAQILEEAEYRHQLSASPSTRTAFGAFLFSKLLQEVKKNNAEKRSPTIAKLIRDTHTSLKVEQRRQMNNVNRLSNALSVRSHFKRERLTFMRLFTLTRDFTRSCGASCARVNADLRRYCMESKGLL